MRISIYFKKIGRKYSNVPADNIIRKKILASKDYAKHITD
jgi:hypothetical protein